jgi:two-component system, NtrC family, sensor kinase
MSRPRVLIVEDSPTQAFQLSLLLQEAGFDVVTAGDAEAGYARLTQQPFDAVLSDLLLPGASGFELCRRIKADSQHRQTPVIILTSECDPLNVLRGLEAGADDFMTKDHASAEIIGRLRRTMEAQTATGAAPEKAAEAAAPTRSVVFLGAPFEIAAGRDQLLNVLLSAFEDVVYLNRRYEESLEALRRLSEQLRHSVQAEQQTLARFKDAESRLIQAEKLSSLGKMVAGIAHEINNPLAFTSTNVTVLKRDTGALHELIGLYRQADELLASQRPELMARILTLAEDMDLPYTLGNLEGLLCRTHEGLARIERIVRGLRNFARLDESEQKDADLNEGIASTTDLLHGEALQHGVAIELSLTPLPIMTCYPAKINQLLFNVITNAIEACPVGGVVTVQSQATSAGAEIRIADTGVGIAPAIRDKVFDPFFTTKPPGKGIGLGLSISYAIVHEHGGSITFDTAVGKGTTFTIAIPRDRTASIAT